MQRIIWIISRGPILGPISAVIDPKIFGSLFESSFFPNSTSWLSCDNITVCHPHWLEDSYVFLSMSFISNVSKFYFRLQIQEDSIEIQWCCVFCALPPWWPFSCGWRWRRCCSNIWSFKRKLSAVPQRTHSTGEAVDEKSNLIIILSQHCSTTTSGSCSAMVTRRTTTTLSVWCILPRNLITSKNNI